jgi:hypothetical protein
MAYFQYFLNKENIIEMNRVWQDPTHIGLNRKIIFDFYLDKYQGLVTGDVQTEYGERSVKKLLKQALDNSFKIYVIKNNEEKIEITDINDIDKYYSHGIEGLKYKFAIIKL